MDCVHFGLDVYISTFMKITVPSISKQLTEDQIFKALNDNYSQITKVWFNFQMDWMQRSYLSFKDHDKYLIVIYLVHKTLQFYSSNFVKLNFDNYYSKSTLEIPNFNIINISRELNITKETARRKILELEKLGAIQRSKKKIILNRNVFQFQRPNKSMFEASNLLSKLTETLYKNGDMNKKISSKNIEIYMRKNFTHCWKLFFDMQIPLILNWKKFFNDIETWHIWGIIATQKSFINNSAAFDREKFIKDTFKDTTGGINAMSISDLTGIPRATVVRKINNLLNRKLISVDTKKLYSPKKTNVKNVNDTHKLNTLLLVNFFCNIINLVQSN